MAEKDSGKWTRDLFKLQTESSDTFGLKYNKNGVLVFSQKGLDSVQRDILEGMIDERLDRGVYSLKKQIEKKKEWNVKAGDKGFTYIPESTSNGGLFFTSYVEERDFFNYLQDVLELVDFYYDAEGARDYIKNGFDKNVSPEDVAHSLREGLHEPTRVNPPSDKGFMIWGK